VVTINFDKFPEVNMPNYMPISSSVLCCTSSYWNNT